MPLFTVSPRPRASSVGRTPMPTTTRSAGIEYRRPASLGRRSARRRRGGKVTVSQQSARNVPASPDHRRAVSLPDTTVTSTSRWRNEAATSNPMNPAPTTTTRRPRRARRRRLPRRGPQVRTWGRSAPGTVAGGSCPGQERPEDRVCPRQVDDLFCPVDRATRAPRIRSIPASA
jgi:hypothetical protein